jgi:Co/Zn/Cd efflux system component
LIGGVIAGSLAIISDAAHLLTDFASFILILPRIVESKNFLKRLRNYHVSNYFKDGWLI